MIRSHRSHLARRIVALGLFVAALLPGLLPAAQPGPRLGFLLPPSEPQRLSLRRGAELALDRYNATSTAPATLVIRGRPGQWGDDGDEAGRLVLDDGAQVLIAPPDGAASHLALQVAGRTQTPVVTLCPDTSVTRAGIPWVLQLVPSTSNQARALWPHGGSWLVLVGADRSGREASRDLRAAAEAAGATVQFHPWSPANWPALAPGVGVGTLFWLPPEPAAVAIGEWSARGGSGMVAGSGSLRDAAFLRSAGARAGEFRVPVEDEGQPGSEADGSEARAAFAVAYRARFGETPDFPASLGADAVGVALALIRRAGGRPIHLMFPLDPTNLGRGLTGDWKFERTGERRVPLRALPLNQAVVVDGRLRASESRD